MTKRPASMTQEVITQLEDSGFDKLVCIEGSCPRGIQQQFGELGDAIEDLGRTSVVVDAGRSKRGRGPLYETLSHWVESHCQTDCDETPVMRLFDYLTMALDMESEAMETAGRGELIVDAVVRLVERLADDRPAVVVVAAPEELSDIEVRAVQALMSHFLGDRLAGIDPDAVEVPKVGFVWAGAPKNWSQLEVDVINLGDERVGQIGRFLGDDGLGDGLFETTEGDPDRLDALLDAMPDTITQLWRRRVAQMSDEQRHVAQYLGVAGVALEVGFVDRLVDGPVVTVVRDLCDMGVARRIMSGGAAKVQLVSEEVREGIVETLDEDRRRQLHLMLAKTAVRTTSQNGAFIAGHALAGGDEEVGLRHGLPAARQLLCRGRWEKAGRLLKKLEEVDAGSGEEQRQILELNLRLAEADGSWKQALSLARRLRDIDDQALSRPSIDRRIATCLMKIGRSEAAREQFTTALEYVDDSQNIERAWLLLGLAQLAYQRGDCEGCTERVVQVHEVLADTDGAAEPEQKIRVESRRLMGKAALFRGELDEAWNHFEKNAAQGRRLGSGAFESRAEINLGVVAIQKRRYDEGARRLQRALKRAKLPGESVRLHCWLNLGIVEQRRGDFSSALDYYRRALREATRRGDDPACEVVVHNLATLYQDVGAFDEARKLMDRFRARQTSSESEQAEESNFAARWIKMVEAQILLDEQKAEPALEMLQKAAEQLGDKPRLYADEIELRRAIAYLQLDQVDEAQRVVEAVDKEATSNPQLPVLHRYLSAAIARQHGRGPDEATWRTIVEQFESFGLYQDALSARVELAESLLEAGNDEVATTVVDRGIEDFRRRADKVPDRFRDSFFAIPVHSQLVEIFDRLRETSLPEPLRPCRKVWTAQSVQVAENEDGGPPASTQVDRDDPAYGRWRARYSEMIGEDARMLQVFRFIDRVAPSETTVLLCGESGTGKELVAEAVHRESDRSHQPFVKVNCAAFVEELLLSELFGHKKGAFTGAVKDREGRFERADGGTIFLDEIGDISPKTQVALLRVLQEGAFETVGGSESRSVDVRVVAATNRDLEKMVRQGEFRLDLYYRLKGFLIEMPPLRERRQDIPRLLRFFAAHFAKETETPDFSEEAIQFLARYRWPGNVRELENFVRSVLLFAEGNEVGMDQIVQFREFFSGDDIDDELPEVEPDVDIGAAVAQQQFQPVASGDTEEALVEEIVADQRSLSKLKKRLEHKCIKRALRQTGGNITQAARILQMKRPRLSQIVNGDDELLALKKELVG